MRNLKDSTLAALNSAGYVTGDVAWVGNRSGSLVLGWNVFVVLAARTNFDQGYGTAMVASDLVVVMLDGSWFERREYDGSEWWDHNRCPQKQDGARELGPNTSLAGRWGIRLGEEPGEDENMTEAL